MVAKHFKFVRPLRTEQLAMEPFWNDKRKKNWIHTFSLLEWLKKKPRFDYALLKNDKWVSMGAEWDEKWEMNEKNNDRWVTDDCGMNIDRMGKMNVELGGIEWEEGLLQVFGMRGKTQVWGWVSAEEVGLW